MFCDIACLWIVIHRRTICSSVPLERERNVFEFDINSAVDTYSMDDTTFEIRQFMFSLSEQLPALSLSDLVLFRPYFSLELHTARVMGITSVNDILVQTTTRCGEDSINDNDDDDSMHNCAIVCVTRNDIVPLFDGMS